MTFTDQNVHEIIASGKPVVIGKYNIEEENDLAMKYRIMSIPTILFFKNGEQISSLRMAGAQQKADLKARIEELLAK